jgi:uncharacterized protein
VEPSSGTLGACALLLAAASAALALSACGGSGSVDDPVTARCDNPKVTFGKKVALADHTEVDVGFRCAGARLAGTLYLPKGKGRFPAVVYVHSSGETPRWSWRVPWVQDLVRAKIAFLSYDKRGVGESEGECCPGDSSHFNLLAADADGAVNALWRRPEIDPTHVGFLGTSQAGWVVPLAVSRAHGRVAFAALADGPAVTTHEEEQWSRLAGEEDESPPPLTAAKRAELTRELEPSGFDPAPLLRRMTVPAIWVYGRDDRSQPAVRSAANLERIRRKNGRNFTVVVFPRAGHGLLDTPPSDPRAMPTLLRWIKSHTKG